MGICSFTARAAGRRPPTLSPTPPPWLDRHWRARACRGRARLNDERVASEEGGRERVEHVVEGVVPRHDRAHHAHRVVLHARRLVEHLRARAAARASARHPGAALAVAQALTGAPRWPACTCRQTTSPGPECARSSGVRRMRSSRMRRPGPASAPVRKKPCWRAPRRRAARAAPGRASGRPGPPGLRPGARHCARAAPLGAQVARALARQPGQLLAGHHHLPERRVHHRLARVARGHAAPAGPGQAHGFGSPMHCSR